MSTLRITQVRSTIGRTQDQRNTVRSLGLKRIRHSVERADGPEVRGMLRKVPHLVQWEFVDGDEVAATDTQAGQAIVETDEPELTTESDVETSADTAQAPADTDTGDTATADEPGAAEATDDTDAADTADEES